MTAFVQITLCLFLGFGVCAILTLLTKGRRKVHSQELTSREFEEALKSSRKRHFAVQQKIDLLAEHLETRHDALTAGGYEELSEISALVAEGIDECRRLWDRGKKFESQSLLRFIDNPSHVPVASVQTLTAFPVVRLVNWEHFAGELTLSCIEELERVSQKERSKDSKVVSEVSEVKGGQVHVQ